ncbi:hypothetical protein FB384_004894 [Prauserella sediminis]|uniref:Uncharacterized protein n=1 Tax=Prauserella sediminis TaxID=577680 RepID=A0A839Y205_9PSEU|nr:hypothetical protein [Prauserella sediminis]MBB3665935.1 hypothetical protein [Prauserella sediminis]
MRAADRRLGPPAQLPITFAVDDDTYTLPELDTRTILDALVLDPPGCWWHLIPTQLDGDGPERLWLRLRDPDDPFDLDDLENVAETVLGDLCGMDLYAATRLAGSVYGNWMIFDGWSYTRGVDPLAQPIGRLLSAAYYWRRSLCTKDTELGRLDHEIWGPPPPRTMSGKPRDPAPASWSDEVEANSFMQAMAQIGRG